MELKIQNVNKIKSADMQLNGLTVIVGENDSGKSSVGRVLFSAIKDILMVFNSFCNTFAIFK